MCGCAIVCDGTGECTCAKAVALGAAPQELASHFLFLLCLEWEYTVCVSVQEHIQTRRLCVGF